MKKEEYINIQKENRDKKKIDVLDKINKIENNNHNDILMIESDKRKITININKFLLDELDTKHPNRSKFIEGFLKEEVEKKLNKNIVFVKKKDLNKP
jgi:hypothetical protein